MTVYSLSDITQIYGEKKILDISKLYIEKGKIYALLGPNGAGKTTLLNILAFLEHPSAGKMWFNTKKVRFSERYLHPLRQQVVMIPQSPIMFSTTVYKNIEFGLRIRKTPKNECQKIIEESLEMVGMRHFIREKAHHLSGGETQRLSFARAIALSPEVILCDEPTANVDLENQTAIINILSDINVQKNITLIFTSHDMLQASHLADHEIFLEHGKLTEAVYENLFTGEITEKNEDFSLCMIHQKVTLRVPPVNTAGKIRFLINPRKLIPVTDHIPESPFNIISGRVAQIVEENHHIRIILHTGITISLLLKKDLYTSKPDKFIVGNMLDVIIPKKAIRILA